MLISWGNRKACCNVFICCSGFNKHCWTQHVGCDDAVIEYCLKHHATIFKDDGLTFWIRHVLRKTRRTKISVYHFKCTIAVKKITNSSSFQVISSSD